MATPQPGVWGIDLGQCALKAMRLELVDGAVKATAFDYIEHAKILSQPDADPDQLVREALTQFLSRNNIKGDMVVIGVPGQSGLARFVKLPPVEEKKIADIVKFEAKQQIPFPLEEVVWDFQKVSEGAVTDGFALETEIGLFAMKRDMVNRALQHFKDVNVEVHIIQMAPLALVNYVAYDLLKGEVSGEGGKKDCIVALDIGTDNSNLVITDGAKIIWQRPIPLGGNHFTRALTKDLKLTFAKAEHLKRNAVKSPDLKKILASLKPVLNDFVGEVQRSLGYFTNTHRDANIQYMIGLGNAFRLPGIQKFLQEKLQLEVRKLQSFDRVQGDEVLGAPQFSENIMSFGVPFGLSLQGLKQAKLQTNLLPYEVRVERIVRGKKPWAVAAAAALLLAVAGLTFGQSLAKSAFVGAAIEQAEKKAKIVLDTKSKMDAQSLAIDNKITESDQATVRISAGVNQRFDWQLLMQYVNMSLPQINGQKLTTRSKEFGINVQSAYLTDKAAKAMHMYEERRFPKNAAQVNADKAVVDDEFIKAHLVQVSIEGINTMYTDDLNVFFKKLHKDTPVLKGMKKADQEVVIAAAAGGDSQSQGPKGYVTEVRGYTYHNGGEDFVIKTLLENLKEPEQDGVNPGLGKANPDMKTHIIDNLGYFVLYKIVRVPDPELGIFKLIKTSYLRPLIKGDTGGSSGGSFGVQGGPMSPMGGGAGKGDEKGDKASGPNRDSWKPLGDIAASALIDGGGGGGLGGGFGGGGGLGGAPAGGGHAGGPPQVGSGNPMGAGAVGGGGAGAAPAAKNEPSRRQDRYEFVILFVWKEPAPAASGAPDAAKK